MGEFDGRNSGVTAQDLARAPAIGTVSARHTYVPKDHKVGDQYIDHGPLCEGRDDRTAGCFMNDKQRGRLIGKLENHIVRAQMNYKHALAALRVDELMKKDDDLHWVVSLALDVAGAHILGVAARALKNVKASGLANLADLEIGNMISGDYTDSPWASRAETLLHAVTDKSIDTFTKTGFDLGKKKVSKGVQNALNAGETNEKANAVAFIDQLNSSCDIGFLAFSDYATTAANDAELVVLFRGMHPSNHSQDAYKAELDDKLGRYKRSGVTDIGRKQTLDRDLKRTNVHRDTRVIWLMNRPGTGKTLYYQSQEGDFDPSVVKPGDPGSEWAFPEYAATSQEFGPRNPRESAQLGRRVPEEFLEAAVARSEQLWGETKTIDPSKEWFSSQGYAPSPTIAPPQPPVQSMDPSTIKAIQQTYFGDDESVQPMDVFKQKPKGGPTSFVPVQDPR